LSWNGLPFIKLMDIIRAARNGSTILNIYFERYMEFKLTAICFLSNAFTNDLIWM